MSLYFGQIVKYPGRENNIFFYGVRFKNIIFILSGNMNIEWVADF